MSEAAKKPNVKKIVIAVAVLAVIALLFGVIYAKFAPKATAGSKEITIVVVDDEGESIEYAVKTDAEYLGQAFEDAEGLEVEGEEGPYGLTITKVNGLEANYNTDAAYWSLYVGEEYGNYGADEQPIEDGETYKLVYTKDN